MVTLGRPKAELTLSDAEYDELERLAQRSRTNRNIALRAKIVLRSASGLLNTEIAGALRTSEKTVGLWRRRFVKGRVAALYDEPRPGAPRKVSDADVEEIIVRTLESKPKGRTHWSTRSMSEAAGVSHSTVGRIWRTFGLQPHVVRGFKLSDDPHNSLKKFRNLRAKPS